MDKERRTTLYIEFIVGVLKWGLVGFLLFSHTGCSSNIQRVPLFDQRNREHSYEDVINLHHLDTDVRYCQVHHKWEVITALWDSEKDGYDYLVVKHRREK